MPTRRVLLLEDDPPLIRLIEVCLRGAGFDTVEARTVGDAWREVQERQFDAAIVDIHLPGVYGWEFIDRIRRDRVSEQLPVLIVSGGLDDHDLRRSRELGCEVMEKPFDPDDLVDRIQSLVGHHRAVQLDTRPARVMVDSFVLEGELHLPPDIKSFSDGMEELMADDCSFVSMSAARMLTFDGKLLHETPSLQVSKAHIRAVSNLDHDS